MDRATLKELLRLAYPMIISQGAFAVMIFTDRYFMSLVSPTHMGGITGRRSSIVFLHVAVYWRALL